MQNTILVQYSVLICRLWFVIFMITLFQQAGYVIFIHQHWGLCKYYLYYLSCQIININFLQRLKVIGVSYLMGIFIVCLYPILYSVIFSTLSRYLNVWVNATRYLHTFRRKLASFQSSISVKLKIHFLKTYISIKDM